MPYYTYILEGSNHWYYVGSTNNIQRRLEEHKIGKGGYYTHHKFKGKLLLKYIEKYNTREEAEARERQLKGWNRRKKEALMDNNIKELVKKTSKNKL